MSNNKPYSLANTEKVLLFLGTQSALSSPSTFVASQVPFQDPADHVSPAATILAYTLGSIFVLLAGVAILCTVLTKDAHVTKYYLMILMCGDVGHLVANYAGMGSAVFWAYGEWNEVMWGNIAVTVFLFLNRLFTVLGVFGRPGWVTARKSKVKGKGRRF